MSHRLPAEDPTAASILDRDCDTREGETIAMNYKPSPLQVKLEKQRELARKGSLKNGNMGSPVNQQPKKNNVMARTRLVVPNKGYSSLDQSPDEKPLVALDTDSDDDFDMSRYSSSGYSSAELQCTHPISCSAKCPDAYGYPGAGEKEPAMCGHSPSPSFGWNTSHFRKTGGVRRSSWSETDFRSSISPTPKPKVDFPGTF
ncbi:protein FAM219A-like isoform X3 [Columba livia]|uniref:protein FAM219A-like isoform X3 n=1 Tax=Columba livia TaxID=8932 RepID=UPI0031BBBF0C